MSEAKGFGAITTLTVCGRYNGLTEELGGPDTPGIGFGMGLERLLMALEAENIDLVKEEQLDSFIVAVGDKADKEAIKIVHKLRQHDIQIDKDYQGRKVKAQFKAANRYNARFVLILGDDELEKDIINIRDRKSTRLNSSHVAISYAVFCLKIQINKLLLY